ncbi:MAG TPA: hypothetical protein VGF57_12010, partial [Roseiarcus sp.]
ELRGLVRSLLPTARLVRADEKGRFGERHTEGALEFWQIGDRVSQTGCFDIKTCLYDYVS